MSEGADQEHGPKNGAAYFGTEVKALRDSLGLSQDVFADKLHYNQGQVSKVENGGVMASEAFAVAMDRVAGTPGVYQRLRNRLAKQGIRIGSCRTSRWRSLPAASRTTPAPS
ncbi:helix-turn-helix domain-containing protein [Streptomyces murinus]